MSLTGSSTHAPSILLPIATSRISSSKNGRVPISQTAAYSWLQVQKILEISAQPKSQFFEKDSAGILERSSSPLTRNNSSS
ncbi:hypothetical protein BGW36DRAFT_367740 [Talaromyces proteolyticus]|uniref:Uncharacterized protein n=1 Tax=Talaromyces proteolyticus TaxID=1131652 RepID=A0AAD4L434_9EURO|nr:uncharacterized protein BGW36DRAFT_367740 [Talaromyces proteolyticus]KAH8705533.1 hypothetical protein BGW36DRAFT_367740 [Talaromyces proteolyticus]